MSKGSLNKILRVHFRREAYFPGERGDWVILKSKKSLGEGNHKSKKRRIVKLKKKSLAGSDMHDNDIPYKMYWKVYCMHPNLLNKLMETTRCKAESRLNTQQQYTTYRQPF